MYNVRIIHKEKGWKMNYDKLTPRQQEIINMIERCDQYEPNTYCERVGEVEVVNLGYFNLEGDLYYTKSYHYKLKANGNIITESYAYKKVVTKINNLQLAY